MKFSYYKLPAQKGKWIELPLIPVEFPFSQYLCLVDSGADSCHFHGQIGELLKLKVQEGEIKEGSGITGHNFTSYFHEIELKIGGRGYKAKVGFSYNLGVPFGILGREGFFSLFKVIFYHYKRQIEIRERVQE